MDWGYFASAAGLLLSVLTFFFGRKSAAKEDGKLWVTLGNIRVVFDAETGNLIIGG